ncbi:MAG: tetratricopeptide repeat protein [Eubacteriales bacterium]
MCKIKQYISLYMIGLLCFLTGCGTGTTESENIELAMQSITSYDYEVALDYLEVAVVQGEDLQEIARGRGLAYMGLGQYEEAITYLEGALAYSDQYIDEIDYDINYYLAVAYFKAGQFVDANDTYAAIIAMKPKEESTYYLRGIVKLELGLAEEALADFQEAITLSGDNIERMIDIFCVLTEYGETDNASIILEEAMAADQNKMSDFEKGKIYFYLEDYEEARIALEKVKDTEGVEAVYYLGKTYEVLGDYNYALSVYNNYLSENTEDATIYNQLGLCQMMLGDYQAALTAFQAALAIEGSGLTQSLKYNEIICYEYLGEFAQATVLMKTYLTTYPNDADAMREYEFLQTR